MDLTERHDLRGGVTPWEADAPTPQPADPLPADVVDVAIVGAGIMGAMLAERLSGQGLQVALLDRRPPAEGSTAASTALVLWEIDVPLTHLARTVGEAEAARRWRRVHSAVTALAERIDRERLDGERTERVSLYLDGDLLDEAGLRAEAAMRVAHGLPSEFLEAARVADRFGVAPRPGIVSSDSYEVNPVTLALALIERARAAGATISYPVDVGAIIDDGGGLLLETDAGPVRARQAILAGGYERARLFLPPPFALRSSYAIATKPGVAPLWRGNAMIWEASEAYLYARADADGRVIAGGGDEDFFDARRRDSLIPEKAEEIAASLGKLVGDEVRPDFRWAAMFGESPDGLPAIGRAANHERLWLASGFGGNGVSFAALAAELLGSALTGSADEDAGCFDPYRF